MGKRKIALFATGWSAQLLEAYLEGMNRGLEGKSTDIFVFIAYPTSDYISDRNICEFNIYNLPDLTIYDGIVVLSSNILFPDILNPLLERCRESGVPTVSLGVDYPGIYSLSTDNSEGMRELCAHLVDEHHIKRPAFIAGAPNNPDSTARLDTFVEELKKRGIDFKDEYLAYTNWSNFAAIDFIWDIKKRNLPFPDAFVCANDGLAMATVITLEKMGLKVPDDVIVTGFDFLFDSQCFDPSIASVDQQFSEVGYKSVTILLDKKARENGLQKIKIPCKFIPGESCGCGHCRDSQKARSIAGRNVFLNRLNDTDMDGRLAFIEKEITSSKSYKELYKRFHEVISQREFPISNSLHMLLNPTAFLTNENTEVDVPAYRDTMQVLFSIEDGIISNATVCNTQALFPNHTDNDECHIYTVAPLSDDVISLGYFITRDTTKLIFNKYLQRYQARLNLSFQKFRANLNLNLLNGQLVQMMKKDALTNVKNRKAYDEAIEAIDNQIKEQKQQTFAVIMFDINNLKAVNDEYGHEAGDQYIISSCKFICSIFSHSPIFRIGGDEFAGILSNIDYDNRDKLQRTMNSMMEAMSKKERLPITRRVSVASGIAVYDPKTDKCFHDVFKRADALMYKNKDEMKRNNKW